MSSTSGLVLIFAFRTITSTGGLVLICAAIRLAVIDIVGCRVRLWGRSRRVWRLLAFMRGRLELGLDDSFQHGLNRVMLVRVVMRIFNDKRTKLKP